MLYAPDSFLFKRVKQAIKLAAIEFFMTYVTVTSYFFSRSLIVVSRFVGIVKKECNDRNDSL